MITYERIGFETGGPGFDCHQKILSIKNLWTDVKTAASAATGN